MELTEEKKEIENENENEMIVTADEVQENTEPEEKKKSYPNQAVLTIRAIVGAYVFYLAYQIVTSGNPISIPMWIAVIVFFGAGAFLVIMSVKHFICGEYEGKKDEKH